DAARRRPALLRALDACNAMHAQPTRRERLRRGRRDRRAGGDRECRRRCAEAARCQTCRDAADAAAAMAGHPTAPNARRRGLGRGPMYEFEYQKPASLDDMTRLLGDEDAKLVAGGMTLIPTLKLRLAKPTQLIDLGAIPSLKGITDERDAIVIGAMTRQTEVNRSDAVKPAILAYAEQDGLYDDYTDRHA